MGHPILSRYTYTLSKVLEKYFKTRLYNFLEKSNGFSKILFGFRKNKGTSIALETLVGCIHNNLDELDPLLTTWHIP